MEHRQHIGLFSLIHILKHPRQLGNDNQADKSWFIIRKQVNQYNGLLKLTFIVTSEQAHQNVRVDTDHFTANATLRRTISFISSIEKLTPGLCSMPFRRSADAVAATIAYWPCSYSTNSIRPPCSRPNAIRIALGIVS